MALAVGIYRFFLFLVKRIRSIDNMKVFFDGKIFSLQSYGGVSRIFFELMRSFALTHRVEQSCYRGIYIDRYPINKTWFERYYGLKRHIGRGYRFIKPFDDRCLELLYNLNANSSLIYHSSYYRVPKYPKGPIVIHAFDMIHEQFNGYLKTKLLKKNAFNTADLIISISGSTKKDLCEFYQIDQKKVIIAYPGVSNIFHERNLDINPCESAIKIYKKPYMLYVGGRDWYKNFDLLLNAFISKKYFYDFDLVLVGGGKHLSPQQQEAVSKCHRKETWIKQKFCNDFELAGLYSNAAAFICTSLYEGFGITLVEAMACGCPVIASNVSSIPEVLGNAGLLFNPKDSKDLGRKIDEIINNPSLSANLVRKGRLRAQKFTWTAMADAVYRGYSSLL